MEDESNFGMTCDMMMLGILVKDSFPSLFTFVIAKEASVDDVREVGGMVSGKD